MRTILGSKWYRIARHIFVYPALLHYALFSENHLPFSLSCSTSRPPRKDAPDLILRHGDHAREGLADEVIVIGKRVVLQRVEGSMHFIEA